MAAKNNLIFPNKILSKVPVAKSYPNKRINTDGNVRGADAAKFLQGQLTCNLNYLDDTHASLGARCTQKGRMQSSFRIVLQGDGVLLAMASELLEPQLADLKKYAVFSKSKLTDESATWARFGLVNADQALASLGLDLPAETDSVARHEELLAIRVSPGRAELWAPAAQAESLRSQLAATGRREHGDGHGQVDRHQAR